MVRNIILNVFIALQFHHVLVALADETFRDHTHPVDQDQISDLLVSQYDCLESLNVRRFSPNRNDNCRTNPDGVALKEHVFSCLLEIRQLLSQLTNVLFIYKNN